MYNKTMHNFSVILLLHLYFLLILSDPIGRNISTKSIVDEPACQDVGIICHNLSEKDDVLILECLLASNPQQLNRLNRECQNIIWGRVRNITAYDGVQQYLSPFCGQELKKTECQRDNYLKCLVDKVNNIENQDCYRGINRLESIAFTDYKWISDFLDQCNEDIKKFQCGVIDGDNFSQIKSVSCLQNRILEVGDKCRKEVFHLSELQSNNIKLDAQLYLECREDYQRYCGKFLEGSGRVFPCLIHQLHLDDSTLATKCRQHLRRREKLISQEFRVSKGLLRACKEDIKKTRCKKNLSSDKSVRLAQILLCLEDYVRKDSNNPSVYISSECDSELTEHRRMLMEDYRLSPEVVNNCKNETAMFCQEYGIGGKTLHCLMGHARNIAARLGPSCMRALEDLMHQVDPGENWNVDPVLRQACDAVVKVACRNVRGGNGRVMSCLMDNMRSEIMTVDCENALLEIQYFVARDFALDPQLYRSCSADATKRCHFDTDSSAPSYSRQVLPCLYRYAYLTDESMKLDKQCLEQVQRVMRQRALSVHLQPEIEEACVKDLSFYCQDKLKKGEEMMCLQEHLEELQDKCRDTVESFTEIESQRVELNPYISKYCGKIIDDLCADEDDIVECLIGNKNNPQVKSTPNCRASVEHFQLISLKDYRFTYKFKVACKPYAKRFCGASTTKSDVIECLSEHVLNATINGDKGFIPKECKQQLKAQIFQQRENIDYDPQLKKFCLMDIRKFCKNVQSGEAKVLECLQMVPHEQLSPMCGKKVFKIQKLEVFDNSVDYALLTNCAESIDQFCPRAKKENVFDCLKLNKEEKGFSKKCRLIVTHRLMEQTSNSLLNPSLQKNCQSDINSYCKKELIGVRNDKRPEDLVIKCLKNQFKLSKLSNNCEQEIAEILREMALNVQMDPLLKLMCKNELETICKPDEDESGATVECLKNAFISKEIPTQECRVEVAALIEGSEADIQADPLLQRACALDLLTHCKDIEQGNGRKINCLKTVMSNAEQDLSRDCKEKLKERLEMYRNAAQVIEVPSDLKGLVRTVSVSPSKNYFAIVLFMMIGAIFFVGVFCGRFSKRKYRLLKNK
ncbi:Golgi apparatus protein 1 [Diorhabda sublineata]|uniref:Golgi apparatus protein 1 n=1 Tax=Diorhabda sublineata TaxID=1163346 RepID=UPI0024E16A31|nr:Golgi apparatus protein 1 [Diorhabda sublineata]